MSYRQWIKDEVREAKADIGSNNDWTPKVVPALLWIDKNTKQLIGVPIFLYTEFYLDPDKMPDDSLPFPRYHPPRKPKKVYRREQNTFSIPSVRRFPQSGKRVEIKLPSGSQILKTARNRRLKIESISFTVPYHVDNAAISFFLAYCCDRTRLPPSIKIEKTDVYLENVIVRQQGNYYAHLDTRTMTPNDLGIKDWILKNRTI